MNRKLSEKHIAYHEAGHVLAFYYLIGDVEATIIPEYDSESCIALGRTKVSFSVQPSSYEMAVSTIAGPCAAAKYLHRSLAELLQCELHGDYRDAYYHMRDCCNLANGQFSLKEISKYVEQDTRAIINTRWNWVQAIAQALLEKKTLTYGDFLRVIDPLPILEFWQSSQMLKQMREASGLC